MTTSEAQFGREQLPYSHPTEFDPTVMSEPRRLTTDPQPSSTLPSWEQVAWGISPSPLEGGEYAANSIEKQISVDDGAEPGVPLHLGHSTFALRVGRHSPVVNSKVIFGQSPLR